MKQLLSQRSAGAGHKLATMAIAIAALTMASTSWADPVTVKVSHSGAVGNTSGSITIHKPDNGTVSTAASQFKMTVSSGTSSYSDWGDTFGAFCADVYNYLKSPTTYAVSTGADVFGSGNLISTELKFAQVNWLFDTYALSGGSNVQSGTATQNDAALQMALWEIINETDALAPLSLATGNLTITPGNDTNVGVANGWLTAVTAAFSSDGGGLTGSYRSSIYDFYALTASDPSNSQDLLVWRCKNVDPAGNCGGGTPSEISEPGTLLLISLGLGVVYFSTRRRNTYYASLA